MEENNKTNEKPAGRKKKGIVKKILLAFLLVILALILTAVTLTVIYMENLLSMINRADDEILTTMSDAEYQALLDSMQETVPEDYTGAVLDAEDVDWGEAPEIIEQDDDVINILLIGQDRRGSQGRSRSDTIILVTINKPAKTMTITSFLRDLYVQIPGRDPNRINVPYLLGGMPLLDSCLLNNFGVWVDGNIEVDFYGFIDIVDMMGGIDIELTAAEAKYMNANFSWDVDDGVDDAWNLTEGLNHLNGSQALSYARMRNVGNSDFTRTERQRLVVSKLVEKAKTLSVSELNVLLQHVLPMITTDMDDAEIFSYAADILPMLDELEINTMRIPKDGAFEATYVDDMAVLVPDLMLNQIALYNIMRVPEE